ncbi:type II toxin-antitoxin system RelE/ParE family toxin (plasmid) [Citrobacter portucalensis]|uniref:type II toxin-antitoxin system RelE/ParE family toxin n=1 Tax=Citrobacter portucalensis TaxID=1639133 RepID=UPI00351CE332
MSIYKIKSFEKCIKKLPVTDTALYEAATEVMNGLFDADLGGGVIKKRVPLGAGKSSGMRTVVFF